MRIGIISMGLVMAATIASAGARTELIADNTAAVSSETSSALNQAKTDGQVESSRITNERAQNASTLQRLQQTAQDALSHADVSSELKLVQDSTQKVQDSIKTLSPDAQKLLAQNAAPVMRAPDPDAPTKAVPAAAPAAPAPTAPKAAAPEEKTGQPGAAPDKPDKDIHITCTGVSYFDSNRFIGIFTDDVEVLHPQFHLFCEQLEIYMKKDSEKKKDAPPAAPGAAAPAPAVPGKTAGIAPAGPGGVALAAGAAGAEGTVQRAADPDAPVKAAPAAPAAGAAANATPGPNGEAPKPQEDNSIKQAIARGRKVVIIKNTENGDMQIGVCRNATYVGETGDIILRDMPLVQREKHVHYATDPNTYMIIYQNGRLETFGQAKTDIIQEPEKQAAAAPATAPAPAAPPPPAKTGPAKPPATKKAR